MLRLPTPLLVAGVALMLLGVAPKSREDVISRAEKALNAGDVSRGVDLLKGPASQGDVRAQRMLGFVAMGRYSGPVSMEEAANWFLLAAKGGDTYSQGFVAELYQEGVKFSKDLQAAEYWAVRYAMGAGTSAQVWLGDWYDAGKLGREDPRAAFVWYGVAAYSGNPHGQAHLAKYYAVGRGVTRDEIRARAWLDVAVSCLRVKDWVAWGDEMDGSLSETQRAAASELAKALREIVSCDVEYSFDK